jgi:DNA-binding beta-propeller fold protein YncE
MTIRTAIFSMILFGIPAMLMAQTLPSVPSTISYQGRITDADFTIPDGDYEMTFLIYDSASSPNLLWQETQPGVAVSGGLYKVELGAVSPLAFATFENLNAWLEVRIFGQALAPRRRIVSAPFALRAEGEVTPGAIILGQALNDPNITDLGYTCDGSTIKSFYVYQKKSFSQSPQRVPTRITYQGRVAPIDTTLGGTADLVFTIYDAASGGNVLWTESHPATPLTNGLFSVELGSSNPVNPGDLVKDSYLSISVNGQYLSPREKLTSAAYAIKAQSPVPPGGIVLSSTNTNADLAAKKFTLLAGATVKGLYPFTKLAFTASDPSVPLLLNYQGRIAGMLPGSTIDMRFAIYDDASSGNLLYSETIQDVAPSDNIFDVLLGSGDSITPNTFTSPDAFLALTLTKGSTVQTLSPRQRLTSIPFALSAEGAMPPSTFILAGTTNDPHLLGAGFQFTGDTIKTYYVFSKTEVDTTPPTLTIVAPTPLEGFSTSPVAVTVTYSDGVSGVDTASFVAVLNGVTVSGSFTLAGHTATGPLVPVGGYNIFSVSVNDHAGNRSQTWSGFYAEDPDDKTHPQIDLISPPPGSTSPTNTPLIQFQIFDPESGIYTYAIRVDGIVRTALFVLDGQTVSWQVPGQFALPEGGNTISVSAMNRSIMSASAYFSFNVSSTGPNPTITSISPVMGFAGDTVIITGTGFSTTPSENQVYFFSNQRATVAAATSTQLTATVPNRALSGPVYAVVNQRATNAKDFVIALKYGFVANYDSNWVSGSPATGTVAVIDFDSASPGNTVNYIPCGAKPFDVVVTPDGKSAYASDNTGNKICIIKADRAADSDTVQTINITGPRYIAISPDGLEVYVGSEGGKLYTLKNDTLQTNLTQDLGNYQINRMEISPLHQMLYVARNLGNSTRGQVNYISLDRSSIDYLQSKYIRDVYYKPVGLAVSPDQSKIYVANNRSYASTYSGPQNQSFLILDAVNGTQSLTHGAVIDPEADAHDVNWPFDVVFDPRGLLLFASFAEGFANQTNFLGTSNNVGVQTLSSYYWDQNFQAATATKRDDPNRSPKGLAVSPGGKFIFAADFGSYTGEGDKIMALDYAKVKAAIDGDSLNTSYNLTHTVPNSPEALESSPVPGYPNIVRITSGFDGPRNIAFQKFPILYAYPTVVHLGLGGVKEGENQFHWRVHPLYGDSATVGLDGGDTVKIKFPGSDTSLAAHWLAPDRPIFTFGPSVNQTHAFLNPSLEGVGKILVSSSGYPSNEIFVTVPPQNNIQMLVGELKIERNDNRITQMSLISVVKNRLRLPDRVDHDNSAATRRVSYAFPGSRVTASNSYESIVTHQMSASIICEQFSPACGKTDVGNLRFQRASSRQTLIDVYHNNEFFSHFMDAYDNAVRYAGMVQIDLLRTGMNLDLLPDPTVADRQTGSHWPKDGCFSFYSPTQEQWETNSSDPRVSIEEALISHTSQFPQAGSSTEDHKERLESAIVCGGKKMLTNFCDNNHGTYIQIVIPHGISTYPGGLPDFIFFRLRDPSEPSVKYGNTVEPP